MNGLARVTGSTLLLVMIAGCSDDENSASLQRSPTPGPSEAPTATPTPSTPTEAIAIECDPTLNEPSFGPTPGPQVILRFVEPSSVVFPDGSTESLQGALLGSYCFSPNTFFAARVEKLQLSSESLVVQSGCSAVGRLVISTIYGDDMPAEFASRVRIGTDVLSLSGRGPYPNTPPFPQPVVLNLSAAGYEFRLVATREVHLDIGLEYPTCGDWGFF